MAIDIDKLNIEVIASSTSAEKSIDKLITTLTKLSSVTTSCKGLNKIAEQIDKIAVATAKITNLSQLDKLVATVNNLNNLKAPNVTKTVNAINRLVAASNAVGSLGNVAQLATNINEITAACKPMESMGKNTLAPFIKSLQKLPEITKNLGSSQIKEFVERIGQITAGIAPLTSAVTKAENGLVALNGVINSTVAHNGNLASSNATTTRTFTSYGSVLTSVRLKFVAFAAIMYRVKGTLSDCLTESNAYVENLNLFTVSMGEAAKSSLDYAEAVNAAMGIDVSEWIRNQGVFKQITSGFGVITEKANLMSKNLTQIGYDISSFFNINVEESMQKVQSGISGELEPLRRLGYALDVATLQQVAYSNGITQNINTMTQAQKSQLRYIAILQQSKNVMGDMARTIVTPANSMRILGQQFTQLQRAIGNIVSVIAVKLIPYVQVAVRLLTDFANFLAEKLGFELPSIDYSSVGEGMQSVTDGAEDATDAVKETVKQMQRLAGFDEINTLKSATEDNFATETAATGNYDLDVGLPEYDFLQGLDKQSDKLYKQIKAKLKSVYNWLKQHKDMIKTIAGIAAGIWAGAKIAGFLKKLGLIKTAFTNLSVIQTAKRWLGNFLDGFRNSTATSFFGRLTDGVKKFRGALSPVTRVLGVITGSIMGGLASFDFFKKLTDGTLDWKTALWDVAGIVGGLAMAWIFGGVPGVIIAGLAIAVGGLAGAFMGASKQARKLAEEKSGLFNNNGVKISDITDLFIAQATQLENTRDKVKDYGEKIKANDDIIDTSAGKIRDFNSKLEGIDKAKISQDELDEIVGEYETISTAIKDNLGLATQSIIDGFSDKMKTMSSDLGVDLSTVISDLKGMETELSGVTDNAQKTVTEYYSKLYNGGVTAAETEKFKNASDFILSQAKETSTELSDFQKTASSIDFSKIDMQDTDTLQNTMKNLNDSAKEAKFAASQILIDNLANENANWNIAENAYKYKQISKETYDALRKTHNEVTSALKTDYQSTVNDIETNVSAITGALQSALNGNVNAEANYWAENDFMKYYNIKPSEIEKFKKKHKDTWNDMFNAQYEVVAAKNLYADIQKAIDTGVKGLDVSIDIDAGEAFLQNMDKFNKVDSPTKLESLNTVISNGVDRIHQTLQGKSNDISSRLPTFFDYNKAKQGGQNLMGGLSAGLSSKSAELFGNITNTGKTADSSLANGINNNSWVVTNAATGLKNGIESATSVDLTSQGQSAAQSYANGLAKSAPAFDNVLQMFTGKKNLFSTMMHVKGVQGFASGGFPEKSQLFIARENGAPEMVGRMGSRTAVANNDQITEGIYKAVYRAMAENRQGGTTQGDTFVFVDSDEVAARVEHRQNSRNKRTGGRA